MQFEHSTGFTTSLPAHLIQRLDAEKLSNQQKALIMIEKNIQQILKQHVEPSPITGMFEQFIRHDATDEITCLEIMTIIKKLEPNEKETVVDSMVRFLQNAQTNLIQLDQIVTKILLALYHEEVMPVLPIAYGLINTLDMKFTVPIDSRKVCFVREHLHQIGYKGMRDLLKLVLIEKLDQLQTRLTEFQRLQLVPLEDLMLDLLDRRRNFCPSLFVITEVSRIRSTSNVYILPRLSQAIREFVVSFRPLAEVNSVICRSWLYPITGSLIYSWFGNNWRLAEQNFRIYFKTHLPYGTDLLSAQSNFQFMLLKQPRGQTNLHHMSKIQSTYHPKAAHPPISKYNEIIHVLILEAMNAMETTTLPIKAEVNQYNWRHIFHLVSFALCTNYGNFPDLMKDINEQLKVSKFRKARSELMWMILQYTSLSIAKQAPKMKLILEVFNSLYPDTMCWTGSSDDTWEMTRFFAPASIWIMSSKNSEADQPPAPENLDRLLMYLKELINTGKEHKPTDLALIANAYSNMEDVFQAEVLLPILKRLNSTGHLPSYHLPYGIETNGELECLELNFLEALTFHAKQILCQNLYSNVQSMSQNRKLPSPAIIETITRISLKTEPVGVHTRSFAVLFLNQIQNHKQRTEDPNINLILYDLMVYRLKNAIFSINNRVVFINCAFDEMPKPNQLVIEKLPLYILMEQAIIRQFMVAAPYDLLTMTAIFVYRSLKNQSTSSLRFNLFPTPNEVNESEGYFTICPEVTKLLCIHFAMAYKMTADYPNEKSFVTDCISEMNKTQKWPRCSLRWFPQHMKAQEDAELDVQLCANYEKSTDDEQQHMWNSGGVYTTRPPVTFIALFYTISKYNLSLPLHIQSYIKMMPIRNFTENLNALIKYVIWQAQILSKDNDYDQIINALYQIIFVRQYVPFERFFFALILHPNDNESIRISLIILYGLLQKPDVDKTRGIMKRLETLYKILPSNANLLTYNSVEFFKKMFEYRREFGDYDLEKLSDGNDADGSGYRCRVPMYYSNLAERILPVVDILFLRSFEVKIDKPVLEQFLKAFAPVYRYHPQPITFLYKLSYVLDGLTSSENLRRFVGVVCKHLEDDKHSPRYSFLSQEFVIQQHKMPAVKICNVIAERVVAASTYNHQPPEFVARDWRIAEFAPAAQALISGCLELMISSKEAQEIVDGLVEVSMSKPVKRPTDRLNAVAMLLCNLPKRFQYIFFKKVEQSFCWNELKENGPDYLFSSYNIEIMQYSEDKIMGMLALMHAFIQHANVDSLALLSTEINTRFAPKVENETQLIYYLRILTVYLMKIIDREKDSSSQYLQLIITIYDMIPRILEKQSKLKYEDLICDLLYEFKYTVPGSAVNRETEMAIARFPEGMREKLKFLPSPGMRDVSNRLNSHITHPVLTEMCDHGFKNIFHLSDLLTNDKDHTAPQQPPGQMNAAPLPYSNVPQQNSNMSDVVTSTPMPAQNSANQTPIPSVPNSQGPFPHSNQMHSNQQAHFPTTYPNQPMGQIPPQMMPQTSMNHPHPQQHPSMNGQPGHFHPQGQFPYPQQQMQGPYFMGGQPQNVGMHGQPMNYPNQQPPFPTRHPNMNQNQMMYNQYGQNPNPMMPARPPYQHYNQMPPM